MSLTIVGLGALPVAFAGIIAATYFALQDLFAWLQARRSIAEDFEIAVIEDGLREALTEVARKVHYRHNVHCPKCGRFAASVPGSPGASNCKHHGMWLRTELGPVEFIIQPYVPVVMVGIDALLSTIQLSIDPPVRELDELDTGVVLLPVDACTVCNGARYTEGDEGQLIECEECEGTGKKL